jgi:hypothetical protein
MPLIGLAAVLALSVLAPPVAEAHDKVYRIGFLSLPSAADTPGLSRRSATASVIWDTKRGRISRLNIVGRRGAMIVFRPSPPNWFGSRST